MRRLTSLTLHGYRLFHEFRAAPLSELEVLVGANGTGKSTLFEFLRFLRDSMQGEIPPQIVKGAVGQQIFNRPDAPQFQWKIEIEDSLRYEGGILGPLGQVRILSENIQRENLSYLEVTNTYQHFIEPRTENRSEIRRAVKASKQNILLLSLASDPEMQTLYELRDYFLQWRFYSGFSVAIDKLHTPVPIEQTPLLNEDGGNLSAVLHFLFTEHRPIFAELENLLASVVPNFEYMTVKARGAPGHILAFWKEKGVDVELSLADLSDGTLRLLCWAVLALQPNPPSLICIDEPDQGIHPRVLPSLVGLFEKASQRTQIFLATHNSYLLRLVGLSHIAVMRKDPAGHIEFMKPQDSQILQDMLADFGVEEIEALHRSDELERFA